MNDDCPYCNMLLPLDNDADRTIFKWHLRGHDTTETMTTIHDEEKIKEILKSGTENAGDFHYLADVIPTHVAEMLIKQYAEHIRQKTIDEITTWLRNRCDANIQIHGTHKWNSDMEELLGLLTTTQ